MLVVFYYSGIVDVDVVVVVVECVESFYIFIEEFLVNLVNLNDLDVNVFIV